MTFSRLPAVTRGYHRLPYGYRGSRDKLCWVGGISAWSRVRNGFFSISYRHSCERGGSGHGRHARGIIIPLIIIEARNRRETPGATIFLRFAASACGSTKYFCAFL